MRNRQNKYSARRTYSELCGRVFASKAEARRGEELHLLEKAGKIKGLEYQVAFELCRKPKISIKIDFVYEQGGKMIYEDVKGYRETREFRVKCAWLKEKYGLDVQIVKL